MTAARWYSLDEISEYMGGVSRDTVYKWIDRKCFPAHKVGRLWRFRLDEVDNWVKAGSKPKKRKDKAGRSK